MGFLVSASVYVDSHDTRPAVVEPIQRRAGQLAMPDPGVLHGLVNQPPVDAFLMSAPSRPAIPALSLREQFVAVLAVSEADTTASGNARFWADAPRPAVLPGPARHHTAFINLAGTSNENPAEVGNLAFLPHVSRPAIISQAMRGSVAQWPEPPDYSPVMVWPGVIAQRPTRPLPEPGRGEFVRALTTPDSVTLPDPQTILAGWMATQTRPLPPVPGDRGHLAFPDLGWNLGAESIQIYWQGQTPRPVVPQPEQRSWQVEPSPQQDVPIVVLMPSVQMPQRFEAWGMTRAGIAGVGYSEPGWNNAISLVVSGPYVVIAAQVTWLGAVQGQVETQ